MELYVHIPFCVKKCDYCDFLSFPRGKDAQDAYMQALLAEIRGVALLLGEENKVTSVFIGGGTPSLLDAVWIASLMEEIDRKFSLAEDAEITMEANPGTLDAEKLHIYRESGLNRLSLGLQSTDSKELKALGRIHSFEDFLHSYDLVRKAGFSDVNVDLMTAIPGQNLASLERSLKRVKELAPEHISAYSLIVEPGTPFADRNLDLPSEEEERRMYEYTGEYLEEAGYHRYEISNYAREGYECRHNIGYWQRIPYLGFGLGAASLWKERRFSNTDCMEEYLNLAGSMAQDNPEECCSQIKKIRKNIEILDRKACMEEFIFLGLRMIQGISSQDFFHNFGKSLEEVYGNVIQRYVDSGHVSYQNGWLALTKEGISVSNIIMADFLL